MQHSHRPRNSASGKPGACLARCLRHGCMDLNLSIEGFDFTPPAGDAADWQPGAILRMPFSERLCRNGGMVCGQALMAFADTAMVIANLAANRGYRPDDDGRPDHAFHARCHRLRRAGRCARGSPRAHHELRPRHASRATDNKPVAMVSSAFAMLPS